MLIHLVLKELTDHLKTLRFMLMFALITLLLTVSALFYIPEYRERAADFERNNNATLARIAEEASWDGAIFHVFSYNFQGAWVFMQPGHLGFIADGKEPELPNACRPSAFRVYGPTKQVRSNFLLASGQALDWSLIIGLVLSFFALVMVYDSVSGERESGTLRLCLSNSVSRTTFLTAKFLGGFIAIAWALAVGLLVHLLLLRLFGALAFSLRDWMVIGATLALSLVYVAVFLLLGLLISTRTRESAASLVLCLICWALLVIVIPGSGGYIATRLTDVEQPDQASQQAREAEEQALNSYHEKHPELKDVGMSGHWSPGEPLGRALALGDAWNGVMTGYHNSQVRQVVLARKATLVSPYVCYALCLENLAGSGIAHYEKYMDQMQEYRLSLRRYLLDVYPQPLDWWGWNDKDALRKMTGPLDFNSLPKFRESPGDLLGLARAVLPWAGLLFLFGALFFAGAYVAFLRCDVR
ncbi:ABC transporter permease subunit [bacterium]|nr:ABC transporter permease subunit [bacterium]